MPAAALPGAGLQRPARLRMVHPVSVAALLATRAHAALWLFHSLHAFHPFRGRLGRRPPGRVLALLSECRGGPCTGGFGRLRIGRMIPYGRSRGDMRGAPHYQEPSKESHGQDPAHTHLRLNVGFHSSC